MTPLTPPPDLNVTTIYLLLGRLEEKVDAGFSGVHGRLDRLNGKVAEHAEKIAVLEDRSEKAEVAAASAKSRSLWTGSAAAGVLTGAIELAKAFWKGVGQ